MGKRAYKKFADFLKKPNGTYGNLDEIFDPKKKTNFENVFEMTREKVEELIEDKDYKNLFNNLVELKKY